DLLAHLLVRRRGEEDVAGRPEPLAGERRDRDGARRDLPLHVERAAAPDVLLAKLAAPWVDRPLIGVGNDRVGVGEQEQPRPVSTAGQARNEVLPFGNTPEELALDPERLEVIAQELGRHGLVPGPVDRVQTEELPEKLGRLVAYRERRHLEGRSILPGVS